MVKGIRLGNIMVDCRDERELCEFYQKLLGWEAGTLYGRPALTNPEGVIFLFVGEEDYVPPVWPEEAGAQQKQMHFDFQVPSVPAAAEYAVSLGAVRASEQYGGDEFVTLIDPAGHPFCLCAEGNPV